MTALGNTILLIVHIVSAVVTAVFALFGLYEGLMGPADAKKLLKELHIPLSYKQTLIIGFVSLGILMTTCILRAKLLGEL